MLTPNQFALFFTVALLAVGMGGLTLAIVQTDEWGWAGARTIAALVVGVALLVMKLAEVGPGAEWSWWIVLAPFALAVAWWGFADSTGLTQRRAMDKMERLKVQRRERNLEALGMGPRRDRKARGAGEFGTADVAKRSAKDPTL
mgnify:CR=1 FL=1